ncbi:hypothetical protein CRM22_003337 [Opisthorchis felineus]|uniref:Uncharacterized protein n=1 Tax=Opisthorchis felineus TaxID=147828 RepID=A0A4S2M6K1_OPIFE|nr:hypothetical protein CRM22_003337 [Opisthorchis felineus]
MRMIATHSLQSVKFTVMEPDLKDRLWIYMLDWNPITLQQRSFRQRSWLSLIHSGWTVYLDAGVEAGDILFYFSRAFDKVRHEFPYRMLAPYVMHGAIIQWALSYLASGKATI